MMERYDEYKDSGIEWIGEIPAGWEVAPMKTIWSEGDADVFPTQSILCCKPQ